MKQVKKCKYCNKDLFDESFEFCNSTCRFIWESSRKNVPEKQEKKKFSFRSFTEENIRKMNAKEKTGREKSYQNVSEEELRKEEKTGREDRSENIVVPILMAAFLIVLGIWFLQSGRGDWFMGFFCILGSGLILYDVKQYRDGKTEKIFTSGGGKIDGN